MAKQNSCTILISILLLAVRTSLAADEPKKEHSAIKPAPSHEKEHEALKARAKKGDIDVLFVGDSLTWNWKKAGKEVWDKRYAPLKAANFGLGGDRTENILWRLQNGELDGIKPRVVVLLIGTNNIGRNTVPEIAEGIKANVELITSKLPDTSVLLLALLPRGPKPLEGKGITVKKINELIVKLDDGKRVRFLDMGDKFLDKDAFLPGVMRDTVHLEAQGYQIWAAAMQKTLDEMMKP